MFDTIESWVDGVFDGEVRGWAWRPARSGKPVEIEIVANGAVVGRGKADRRRSDLATAGKGDGSHGFAIPLDLRSFDGAPAKLTVRAQGGAPLRNGKLSFDVADQRATIAGQSPSPAENSTLPVKLGGAAEVRGYLDLFGPHRIYGWAFVPARPSAVVEIEIWEAGLKIGSFMADIWRTDLEELHQGDGRWGIDAPFPAALSDGLRHTVDLRVDGLSILYAPLTFEHPAGIVAPSSPASVVPDEDDHQPKPRPLRHAVPTEPLFTFIVVFYNMRREAERTLTSLTRAYQRGIGDLPYEVLCIDNGSADPLDPDWVRGFGPEFRLVVPAKPLPSPCRAINEAAAMAKGRFLAIMIDGAHVLTPGVFREVWDTVEEAPDAVVAIRQWFVGGDQRWLGSVGYSTAHEDALFNKIGWPADGYKLFRIGTPIWESAHHWTIGLIESNCLFLPRSVFAEIGGMNEAFDEPGAGYANLDLFKRAVAAVDEPVVALLGEASFHQFHGGTTTNVSDEEKDRRVRGYESKYARIHGKGFSGVREVDVRLRGQHRVIASLVARHRPLSPARLGITDRVRPGVPFLHLDEMSIDYIRSAYVECGFHRKTRWLGHELSLAPTDVLAIQEIIHQQQPDGIVLVGVEPGVIRLVQSALLLANLLQCRIVLAGTGPAGTGEGLQAVAGAPQAAETRAAVACALGGAEKVMVLFAPDPGDHFPVAALRSYARFVSPRSYLVFLGSVFGQPWLGYSTHWYLKAIRALVEEAPFAVDDSWTQHLITTCPRGYLQRIGDFDPEEPAETPDPSIGR